MASATRCNDLILNNAVATGETRDAVASTSTPPPCQRPPATMAPLSIRQPPEDAIPETHQADHKVFCPQHRRNPEEAGDLESGLWHATAGLRIRSNRSRVYTKNFWLYATVFLICLMAVGMLIAVCYLEHSQSSRRRTEFNYNPGIPGAQDEGSHDSSKPVCGVSG